MAKKSKNQRQLNKQLQQLRKIQKRVQQKGLHVDLSTPKKTEKPTKKQVEQIKQIKRQEQRKLKEPKTNNTVKLTQKQLQKAIASRQQRLKPVKPLKVKQPKITPRKPQTSQQEIPENLTPPTPEQEIPENINTDTSFFAETIIGNYRQQLRKFPIHAEPLLGQWLDKLIAEHGIEDVATMLQAGASEGNLLTFEIAYSMEKMEGYIAEMLTYLPEMTDWYKAEVMEQFETWVEL